MVWWGVRLQLVQALPAEVLGTSFSPFWRPAPMWMGQGTERQEVEEEVGGVLARSAWG